MPLAAPPDLYERLIQSARTLDARVAVNGPSLVALLPADPVHLRVRQDEPARLVPRTGRLGRGLDGIVDRLCGGFALKVNQVHPKVLQECETKEQRRRTSEESTDRFVKDIRYWQKYQSCPFAVPMVPVYVFGENSQRLGYLMPELKSADQFEWPNESMALQVLRQLVAILCFFRKSKVVYGDFKPENILLQEVPDGGLEVKLNDFGFVGTLGGEFKGGTDKYMHPKWKRHGRGKPLDYRLDTYAIRKIVPDMWGCRLVRFEVNSELVLGGMEVGWQVARRLKWHTGTSDGSEPNEEDMLEEVVPQWPPSLAIDLLREVVGLTSRKDRAVKNYT